ncbi:hypothetical protein TraAM80_06166 [Trypanosoma rangeli]|uniref:Uncharacterized protein n=1 Tax=Trypanosoma rangeli TaxID=5698 RepID=A0A422NBE7_TRYRA|nr:uncharacterized protein TraAM80_06166 [Trypanosoma rangeli]RNF02814.1 hypothetical protein TraAM80_06166 [Trypanosoma rangeli]|eukprot:RNF02814.1 hypothetical protein TraAM80_06166 [Trypanosoma rangeli]
MRRTAHPARHTRTIGPFETLRVGGNTESENLSRLQCTRIAWQVAIRMNFKNRYGKSVIEVGVRSRGMGARVGFASERKKPPPQVHCEPLEDAVGSCGCSNGAPFDNALHILENEGEKHAG